MGKILVTDLNGEQHQLSYETDDKLMEVLHEQDMVRAECGGMQICSTCHVLLTPDAYKTTGPATDFERDLIDGTGDYQDGSSRLSCMIVLNDDHDGLELTLGPDL